MPFEINIEGSDEYLGEWEPFRYDKEKDCQVYLRIRPTTEDQQEKMRKKFGVMKMNKRQGVRQRQVPPKNQRAMGLENVLFMWTGIRNGYVKIPNQATADFFAQRLNKEIKVGEEILLPEDLYHPFVADIRDKKRRPFDEIKKVMIDSDTRISNKVIDIGYGTDDEAVDDIDEEERERREEEEQEEDLVKNSQATPRSN